MRLSSTYVIKSLVLGHPIMSWKVQAHKASEYSLTVYSVLFLANVFIRMWHVCMTSLLTSEKNGPLCRPCSTVSLVYDESLTKSTMVLHPILLLNNSKG